MSFLGVPGGLSDSVKCPCGGLRGPLPHMECVECGALKHQHREGPVGMPEGTQCASGTSSMVGCGVYQSSCTNTGEGLWESR